MKRTITDIQPRGGKLTRNSMRGGAAGPTVQIDTTCVKAYAVTASLEIDVTVLTASAARANLYRLIDQATQSHQPIVIAGKNASAVLVSAQDWADIQETMHLLSVPGMRESIRTAMAEPLSKSSRQLKW